MKRRTVIATGILAVMVLLAFTIPAVAGPSWKTKASITSKGAGPVTTEAMAFTVVHRPRAIRVGFRTPPGVSRRVDYEWFLECERREAGRERSVTTPTDGTWRWVTIQSASDGLGRYCDVFVDGALRDRTRLQMQIQAQHR